ncbi:hypothetical protein [Mucilaginibacter aquariorum]|uniref:Uncharacterized protein n=1 Tax=Mucilaginibacter aquariorum TaxID=2967225 RepID=A0ABT1T717_9SPHI|nr:hypothetical protein [Mucilaginibacter aquariorum]MCQ6960421.1 hypothetical protein [Mucilaginibacter aquariorum]
MTNEEKNQLRRDASRLFQCENIPATKDMLHILAECLFQITYLQKDIPINNRADADAKIVLQMILSKTLYLNKMLDGVDFRSFDNKILNNIVDPTLIAVVVRNFCETIATFNLIYTETDDKKLILYNLWAIAGLKFRQRFAQKATTEDNKRKQVEELATINNLVKEIEQTSVYKSLTSEGQASIKKKVKDKDYKIQFIKNDIKPLSWQETISLMDIKEGLMDDMYTYFSLYSHPSNVSVFQFANLFSKQNPHSIKMGIFNISNVIKFVSFFISDYIKLFPDTIKAFESMPLIYQAAINFHNQILRNDGSIINDALSALD